LEEIVIEHRGRLGIDNVRFMLEARASRGAKLKLVRIVSRDTSEDIGMSEFEKHVSHVEWSRVY